MNGMALGVVKDYSLLAKATIRHSLALPLRLSMV